MAKNWEILHESAERNNIPVDPSVWRIQHQSWRIWLSLIRDCSAEQLTRFSEDIKDLRFPETYGCTPFSLASIVGYSIRHGSTKEEKVRHLNALYAS